MKVELVLLGVLFLLGCLVDYAEFKDEIRDQREAWEEEEEEDE